MIPKDILSYGYDEAMWQRYPGSHRWTSELAKLDKPLYFYSYFEDCCFRVADGKFYNKFRGTQAELIDKTQKEQPIDETQITDVGFEKLTSDTKTVEISKEEYDKFSNVYTPWNKSLLRMMFDECTEDVNNINYTTLGSLFYDTDTPPLTIINDARQILGLESIGKKEGD